MMSSTSPVSRPLRSASALSTVAPRTCGCSSASAPLPTFPMPRGVRHASMIQASVTSYPRCSRCTKAAIPFRPAAQRIKSIPNTTGKASRVGRSVPMGRTTMATTFKEMPGAAPDVMRDYDLATLGYEETEYAVAGTATVVRAQGRAGRGRPLGRVARRRGTVPHPDSSCAGRSTPSASAARSSSSGTTSRPASTPHRTGASSTGTSPHRATPGSASRPRRWASTAEGSSRASTSSCWHPERYADARAPGRRLVLRHVHPGRPAPPPSGRREPARRPDGRSTCSRRASPSRPPAW